MKDITTCILEAIENMIANKINTLKYDTTVFGRITAILGNYKYSVEIKGSNYTVHSCNDMTYSINDIVIICQPEGNIKKQFIIGKQR